MRWLDFVLFEIDTHASQACRDGRCLAGFGADLGGRCLASGGFGAACKVKDRRGRCACVWQKGPRGGRKHRILEVFQRIRIWIYLALKGSLIGEEWSAWVGRPEAHDLHGWEHDTTGLVGRIIRGGAL